MFKEKLNRLIQEKDSLLCIGLDCDIRKIPPFLLDEEDPLLIFNREIIEATADLAIAYKPNIAFYETLGSTGWQLLEKTLQYLPGDCLVIADAKRGDIGNSTNKYAELYFHTYSFDAITLSPYMGFDSIQPFLEYDDKASFILCLTSNAGSHDFQYLNIESEPLYLKIARKVSEWNLRHGNCGIVVGATHPENLSSIREVAPHLPFLIPGIGIQGGNLQLTVQYGTDEKGLGAIISISRSIIYASAEKDFAQAARDIALSYMNDINTIRKSK